MRWLTDFIYLVAMLLSAPYWFTRMVARGKLRTDWASRFGAGPTLPDSGSRRRVLIHAVSVGEVNAIRSLVIRLEGDSGIEVVVASTTDTGIERARSLYGDRHHVVRYPLDLSWSVRRFIRRIRPAVSCLVELEVWPTYVAECHRVGCPVLVINGRLSERSFRRYRLVRFLLKPSFRRIKVALVQNNEYAQRFIAMGVREERVKVVGSLKWDNANTDDPHSEQLARALGIDSERLLVVAGSTAPGEHELLHEAVPSGTQLLCAPRRPEWFDEAALVLEGCTRRSTGISGTNRDRYLLDTIGELSQAYSLADIVVIGRSFGSLHGSDVSEPAGLGKPIVVGPAVEDFKDIVGILKSENAIIQCGPEELSSKLSLLIGSRHQRDDLSKRAAEVIAGLRGASTRTAEVILAVVGGHE